MYLGNHVAGRESNDGRKKTNQTKNTTKKPRTVYTAKTEYLTRGFGIYFLVTFKYLCPAANAILNTEPMWCWPTTDHNNKRNQFCSMKVSAKETNFYLQSNCSSSLPSGLGFNL